MIVLTALGTLGMLTVLSVRGGVQTSANDRFHTIALYAAESGGAAAMEYLRSVIDPHAGWTNVLATGPVIADIPGNEKLPGDADNPFADDLRAHYRVEVYNNQSDSGYATGTDTDKRVVIRATGYGPDGAMAMIEWDVQAAGGLVRRPCPVYAQKGVSEDNSGRNDCLGTIDTSQSATFSP